MRRATVVLATLLALASSLEARQHEAHGPPPQDSVPQEHPPMSMRMAGPLGIPQSRDGSGTSWMPDASPMYAHHRQAGRWELMLHGNLFGQYIDDGGRRGRSQLGSVNWVMGMARAPLAGGELGVRAMLSAEPWTVGECGYPDLLATGELCRGGQPIVDRQHPHDLFMELSAQLQRPLDEGVALQLYGGPVGEPALGPGAYPHRISSLPNPVAPISHHWLDATHISFGVATAGLYGRRWKVEGSVFNGREPDEDRYDFDFGPLDSWAGRLSLLPSDRWAVQVSAGRLTEAEAPHEPGEPRVDVTRATASATYHRPLGETGTWATTAAWGRNAEGGDERTHAFLVETTWQRRKDVVFGRVDVVEKTADDLVLPEHGEEVFTVAKLSAGYVRELGTFGGVVPGIGAGVSLGVLPEGLEPFYGDRFPAGYLLFVQLHPARMSMGGTAMPMEHRGHGRDPLP